RLRIEATRQNDRGLLEQLLDEQLIYINSVGEVFDKDHYLGDIETRSPSYDRDFDVIETEVQVLDDVIILVGVMLGRSSLDGERPSFHFPCIGVWRKDSGRWRMLGWQASSGGMAFNRELRRRPWCGHSAALFCIQWGSGARLRAEI